MKGNWAAAPTQQPVLIIICWSVAWAMINDSVRPKTKHSASYLQSTCSCGPIGREWKRVQPAHGLIMGGGLVVGLVVGWGQKSRGWKGQSRGGGGDGNGGGTSSGHGEVTTPMAVARVAQERARFKNSQDCEPWNVFAHHREVCFPRQIWGRFLRARLRWDLSFASWTN